MTTTGKRVAYELLLKKNNNHGEQDYYSSDIEVSKYTSVIDDISNQNSDIY
jgi:hypothetical protein